MPLKIRKEHLNEIIRSAKKCYPMEACGILVGKIVEGERVVCKVYHTRNVLASSFAYQIDPQEQLRVFKEAESQGLEVLGFYHSHPFLDSYWSEVDEKASKYWTGYLYLIISLKTGKINAYVKKDDGVEREYVIIL
jgi:proteasome lid subunit RPN8/RPN11